MGRYPRLFPGVCHREYQFLLDFSLEGLKHFSFFQLQLQPPSPSAETPFTSKIPFSPDRRPLIRPQFPYPAIVPRPSGRFPFTRPIAFFPPQVSLDHLLRLFGTASILTRHDSDNRSGARPSGHAIDIDVPSLHTPPTLNRSIDWSQDPVPIFFTERHKQLQALPSRHCIPLFSSTTNHSLTHFGVPAETNLCYCPI